MSDPIKLSDLFFDEIRFVFLNAGSQICISSPVSCSIFKKAMPLSSAGDKNQIICFSPLFFIIECTFEILVLFFLLIKVIVIFALELSGFGLFSIRVISSLPVNAKMQLINIIKYIFFLKYMIYNNFSLLISIIDARMVKVPIDVEIMAKAINPPICISGIKDENMRAIKPILEKTSNSMG